MNARGEEETYLAAKGTQYHSPRCSNDAHYLSITAWDKVNERGYIEVYERASKKRVARWEGEEASWMRGRHIVIYKLLAGHGEEEHVDILERDMDKPNGAPQLLYRAVLDDYVHNVTEPQFVGPGEKEFVFLVYDEHEFFYYIGEVGKSFVLTRDEKPLSHHNVYAGEYGDMLEQDQLTIAPDGKHAVFAEHPWNTPPSLYLLDLSTRDSQKIAEGFNPVWSADSSRIYFNKDPAFYARYREAAKRGKEFGEIYPKSLDGYEIYVYDFAHKQETRLTDNAVYDGFL